jgi:hypothetical protein
MVSPNQQFLAVLLIYDYETTSSGTFTHSTNVVGFALLGLVFTLIFASYLAS